MRSIERRQVRFAPSWSHTEAIKEALREHKAYYAFRDKPEAGVWPVDERHQEPACRVKDLDRQLA